MGAEFAQKNKLVLRYTAFSASKLLSHHDTHFEVNMQGQITADGMCYKLEQAGIAQWLERRTRDRKVAGSNLCWSGGRIFLLQGQLSVLTLISVSVPPPCYRSST